MNKFVNGILGLVMAMVLCLVPFADTVYANEKSVDYEAVNEQTLIRETC